jgi:hypothetical protein
MIDLEHPRADQQDRRIVKNLMLPALGHALRGSASLPLLHVPNRLIRQLQLRDATGGMPENSQSASELARSRLPPTLNPRIK